MQVSQDGIRLIKNFEGVYYTAQLNATRIWTIGYRHTDGISEGVTITPEQADTYLIADLAKLALYVDDYVTVPLTQHQFDALVVFCYDLGPTALRGSELLAFLNAGQYERAADALAEYDDEQLMISRRRRTAESILFQTPDRKPGWRQKLAAWLSQ